MPRLQSAADAGGSARHRQVRTAQLGGRVVPCGIEQRCIGQRTLGLREGGAACARTLALPLNRYPVATEARRSTAAKAPASLFPPCCTAFACRSIEVDGKPATLARAGDSADVTLAGVDASAVCGGTVLCHPDFPVPLADK